MDGQLRTNIAKLLDGVLKPDAEHTLCIRVSAMHRPTDVYWGLTCWTSREPTAAEREQACEWITDAILGMEDGIDRRADEIECDFANEGNCAAPPRRRARAGLPKPPAAPAPAPAADAGPDGGPEQAPDTRDLRRHWGGSFTALQGGALTPASLWPVEKAPVLVCQVEESTGESKWLHWQFCVTFAKPRRFSEVKNEINSWLGDQGIALDKRSIWLCNFNEAKDAPPRNGKEGLAKYRNYCRKSVCEKGGVIFPGTRIVRGLDKAGADGVSRKGKRTDLTDYIAFSKSKSGLVDILDEEMNEAFLNVRAKYARFAAEVDLRMVAARPKGLKTAVCFWGNTSTGKSTRAYKLAYSLYKPHEVYTKGPADVWFDGYSPAVHKCIIVDEFGKAGTDPRVHSMLLQMLDKEKPVVQVQVKGGTVFVDPELVIFTSIMHPFAWLQGINANDHGGQYERRFNRILECKRVYQKPAEHEVPPEHAKFLDDILQEMPLDD